MGSASFRKVPTIVHGTELAGLHLERQWRGAHWAATWLLCRCQHVAKLPVLSRVQGVSNSPHLPTCCNWLSRALLGLHVRITGGPLGTVTQLAASTRRVRLRLISVVRAAGSAGLSASPGERSCEPCTPCASLLLDSFP